MSREPHSDLSNRTCPYCKVQYQAHEKRCAQARYIDGEARRCLRNRNHSGFCAYRPTKAERESAA